MGFDSESEEKTVVSPKFHFDENLGERSHYPALESTWGCRNIPKRDLLKARQFQKTNDILGKEDHVVVFMDVLMPVSSEDRPTVVLSIIRNQFNYAPLFQHSLLFFQKY